MRNPEHVLNSLTAHCKNFEYKYERLYRILFNQEMYYEAYQRIYRKRGNKLSLRRIDELMRAIKDESYRPQPLRRNESPKKNGEKRPLGLTALNDILVQEAINMILEAIYEASFENTSHGFRPHRSCQTAIMEISRSFSGTNWFVKGNIQGFFKNIDHDVLIGILKERVADERFLRLIRKFLNAGYIEDWVFHETYSGVPRGGILSPILANIYLDKLDKFMQGYIWAFNKGQVKSTLVLRCDQMDKGYRKLKYVRYADDFLIGVTGSREDCKQIKQDVRQFLNDRLKLVLCEKKTLITHSEKPVKFLSFDVTVRKSNLTKRNTSGKITRACHKIIAIKIPRESIRQKLLDYKVLEIKPHNGREQWKPKPKTELIFNDDLEILSKYNAELIGFYDYYSIAVNSSTINRMSYIMEYSMYKTFAAKYRTTVPNICRKYKNHGVFTVAYTNNKRELTFKTFYNGGFGRKTDVKNTRDGAGT